MRLQPAALPEDTEAGEGQGMVSAGSVLSHLRSLRLHHAAAALGAGTALHAANLGAGLDVLAAGGGTAVLSGSVLAVHWRRLSASVRAHAAVAACYASAWASWAAARGPGGPVNAAALLGGGALLLPWWLKQAPGFLDGGQPVPEPEEEEEQDGTPASIAAVLAVWDEYVAGKNGPLPGTSLDAPVLIPDGVAADIVLLRGQQDSSQALAAWRKVASAYRLSRTRVLMEPHANGVESLARLTVLDREVLADKREWPGSTLDMATGLARAGTFFDGTEMHFRFTAPEDGARHWLIAGTTGSGKSTGVFWCISETTDPANPVPVVNVLIDPEEGAQSLPLWQRKLVLAFEGEDDAIRALRGLDELQRQRAREMSAEGLDCFTATWERPQVNVIIEESSALMKESRHKAEAVDLIARLGKRGRKRGISVILVALVPSLEELDSQTLRSMLRSGNIWCFRTGDSVSGGMLGLQVDPSQLPEFFADGTPTWGLSYVKGPDGRQATARSWNITREHKEAIVAAAVECPLDASSLEAFGRGFTRAPANAAAANGAVTTPAAAMAAMAQPADLAEAARLRDTAAAAVLAFLASCEGEQTKARVCEGVRPAGITSVSTVGFALRKLTDLGYVATAGDKCPYSVTQAGRDWLASVAGQAAS